jgi:MYXO-CTERM domain-containing protein
MGKGTNIVARKNRNYLLGGSISAFSAFLISSTTVLAENNLGGSIGLFTETGSSTWTTDEYGETDWTESGYSFSGSDVSAGWSVNWTMLSGSTSSQNLNLNFTVTNTSALEQTFYLFATDLLNSPIMGSSLVGGSVSGTYTDLNGDGVMVSALESGSIYTAFIDASSFDPFDGIVVGTLLDEASGSAGNFLTGTFAGSAFGDFPTIPGQVGPEALLNYGMLLQFTVSAGDTVGLTSSMAIAAPAPGAVALLGLAGLCGRRRRRRNA